MSQYPSPYNVPQQYSAAYGYDPFTYYLAPARRASVLMFILGGLGLACGLCIGVVIMIAPLEQVIEQSGVDFSEFRQMGYAPEKVLRVMYGGMSIVATIFAIALIVLAAFVRRGGLGAIVTSLVLCGLVILLLLLSLASVLVQLGRLAGAAETVISLFLIGGLLSIFILQFVWLIKAARASSAVRILRQQHQMQYWQYQQQHQMYAQQYGYGQQVHPSSPTPPPPQNPAPPNDQGATDGR